MTPERCEQHEDFQRCMRAAGHCGPHRYSTDGVTLGELAAAAVRLRARRLAAGQAPTGVVDALLEELLA
jgi:hypothetical protein